MIRCRAFSLVELIAVIVILAVLAGVAIPKYVSYRQTALESAEQGVVGAVRAALANYQGSTAVSGFAAWPNALDSAAADSEASADNPFFVEILQMPVAEGWSKGADALTYVSPLGNAYAYEPEVGAFTVLGDYDLYGGGGGSGSGGGGGDDGGGDGPGGGWPPTDEALWAMTPEELAGLGGEQTALLTAEQIAGLSPAQFAAIAGGLDPSQLAWATPEQIAMLSAEAFAGLSAAQLASLTEAQLAERAIADSVRACAYYEINGVAVEHIKYLTAEQLAGIPSDYAMSRISADRRAAFTAEQVQAIDTSLVSIGYLTEAQRLALTGEQMESLRDYNEIRYVPMERVAEVCAALIATIPSDYSMSRIPADVRGAFTAEQVQGLNTSKVSIGYLTESQRLELTGDQMQSLRDYNEIRHVPADRVGEVSAALIGTIPSDYSMSRIPGDVRDAFTSEQVQALDTTQVSIGYLSTAQRSELTTGQLETLRDANELRYVPTDRVGEVSAALIGTIPSDYSMSRIPEDVRGAFTTDQVQAVDTTKVSIGYLTSDQRNELTTAQIESLRDANEIRYVTADRVADVTTTLVSEISGSYQMGRIPTETKHAFTQDQILAITDEVWAQTSGQFTAEQQAWRE